MLRKSQISVFIILGILIIAIFGFMFFITSEVGKIKLETQANKILDSILSTTPINYYVTLCLEEGTKRALNASGIHGGLMEFSENITQTEFQGVNVSYYLDYGIYNSEPDIFPCNGQMNTNWSIFPRYCAFLNNFSAFTYWNKTELGKTDVNRPEYVISPMLLEMCNESVCDDMNEELNFSVQGQFLPKKDLRFAKSEGEASIQKQVEEYIANYTYECSKGILNASAANLTAFRKFEVNVSNITVNAVFGFNGVEVSADYPLIIKIQNVEPVIRILKFSYFSPVRYKYVYLLARWIAEQEMKELDFDILRDWRKFPPHLKYKLNFSVAAQRSNGDTLVMISDIDNNHYLRNGPFQFQFAIKNRPPVLDFIPAYQYEDEYTNKIFSRDYDVYAVETETITIRPKAYDPDGDELNYTYSGWKETEDAYFNESTPGKNCRNESQVRDCVHVISAPDIHKWTTSETYINHSPSASYTTNHSDIGYHNIIICAYQINDSSIKDCQNVTILVDDIFEVIANATSCYDDITNNTLISIEDPVCLDANVIDYFNPGYTAYLWKAHEGSGSKTVYDGEQKLVMVPRDYNSSIYIPGLIDYFTVPGMKNFSLLVTRGNAPPKSTDLQLKAEYCVPHRNNSNPTKMQIGYAPPTVYPSFPFNNLNYSGETPEGYDSYWDPFLANHTCCKDDWTYQSRGTNCFNYSEYGWYNSNFLNIAEQAGVNIIKNDTNYNTDNGGINKNRPTTQDLTNDIIKREFLSYCDGSSGNKCAFNVTAKFTNITACEDFVQRTNESVMVTNLLRRCQGANINANWFDPENPPPTCELFDENMTFEKYIGQDNSEDAGICGPQRCSSDNFSNTGYGKYTNVLDSYYLCKSTCFNGICQKPVNCVNCRSEDGRCNETEHYPEGEDVFHKQTITFSSGYCNYTTDSCTHNGTFTVIPESCKDSRFLYEFRCREYTAGDYPEINKTDIVDCANITQFESEARTVEVNINPSDNTLYNLTCIPGNRSQCLDGACIVNTTEMRSDNMLLESCTGNMFRGVDFVDTDSTGTNESCEYKSPVHPDTNIRACVAVCGFKWITPGNFCCGDDAGEIIASPTCQ